MSADPHARSLVLTLLGDLVLPSGGRVWLAAASEALALLDIPPEATRAALRDLVDEQLLVAEPHGRLAAYAFTPMGRRRMEAAAERIYLRRDLRWDGRWRLLSFQLTDDEAAAGLAREITWLGYGRLDSGLWVCPWDHGAHLDAVLAKHGIVGDAESFTSELSGDDRALAAEAYDLAGLAHAYRRFAEAYRGLPAPDGDPAAALVRRLELVHEWRKFLFSDPGLPPELLPSDWPGDDAAGVFRRAYDEVADAGWAAWSQIAAAADPDGTPPRPARSPFTVPWVHVRADADDARRTEEFRARIAAGGKVEVTDWMPAEYRRLALKFIEMHANSEIMGALPEREWIARAPTLRRKRSLAAKVQDEVGHAHLIYRVAEDLGKSREQMFTDLIEGRTRFHNVFHYPAETWADCAVIGFLVDGAAIVSQKALLDTSYAPYQRCMRRVVAEESFHYRHGEDLALALASGTDEQVEMFADAVARWWPRLIHFYGHAIPAESDPVLGWGIKTRTNEQLRQEFLSTYVPKLWDMGIEVPDPELAYDPEEKVWHYSEPDWEEMNQVISGNGPMSQTRLAWRRWMREHHAWLREVITGDLVAA